MRPCGSRAPGASPRPRCASAAPTTTRQIIHCGPSGLGKGKILSLRPAGVPGARVVPVAWLCGAAPPPSPMEAQGENQTTVPVALLPIHCR